MGVRLDPRFAQRAARALAPAPGERADVGREVNRVGAGLVRDRDQLALGRAVADHEARTALAERRVQIAQALEQELGSRPGRVAAVQQPVVEAEHGDDPVVAVQRGAQRGVVAHAEVAAKPDQSGQATASRRRMSSTAVRRKSKIRSRSRRTKARWASSPSGPSGIE